MNSGQWGGKGITRELSRVRRRTEWVDPNCRSFAHDHFPVLHRRADNTLTVRGSRRRHASRAAAPCAPCGNSQASAGRVWRISFLHVRGRSARSEKRRGLSAPPCDWPGVSDPGHILTLSSASLSPRRWAWFRRCRWRRSRGFLFPRRRGDPPGSLRCRVPSRRR
jgi:hypothetical protein